MAKMMVLGDKFILDVVGVVIVVVGGCGYK